MAAPEATATNSGELCTSLAQWWQKPWISQEKLETPCTKIVLRLGLVAIPAVITLLGYLMINLGNAPPSEEDESKLSLFLSGSTGMGLAAAVSAVTNVIFTAIPMNRDVFHAAVDTNSYKPRNLIGGVLPAMIMGSLSGCNYIPLMRRVVPQLLNNLNINEGNSVAQGVANGCAVSFVAIMMLLNAVSSYDILFKGMPDGYQWLRERCGAGETTARFVELSANVDSSTDEEQPGAAAVDNPVGSEAIVVYKEPEPEPEIEETDSVEQSEVREDSCAAKGCSAIKLILVLGLAGLIGGFYYKQLATYISADNKEGGFSWLPLPAAYAAAAGDLAFGVFFAKDGIKEMLDGVLNIGAQPSCGAVTAKLILGLAALVWSFGTIIPAMAQGQPGIGKDLMALTSVVFNFPASIRIINAVAAIALLNCVKTVDVLYKARATDEHGHKEKGALPAGFNLGVTFADSLWAKCCCPKRTPEGGAHQRLIDRAPSASSIGI
jgi:hypothetical protein